MSTSPRRALQGSWLQRLPRPPALPHRRRRRRSVIRQIDHIGGGEPLLLGETAKGRRCIKFTTMEVIQISPANFGNVAVDTIRQALAPVDVRPLGPQVDS